MHSLYFIIEGFESVHDFINKLHAFTWSMYFFMKIIQCLLLMYDAIHEYKENKNSEDYIESCLIKFLIH